MPCNNNWLSHLYTTGAMMMEFTFLLTFKNIFSYIWYWEVCMLVHQMHLKWLDTSVVLAAFHIQSNKFDHARPVALEEYPDLTTTLRERDCMYDTTLENLHKLLKEDSHDNTL
eukprot:3374542-Ditylum_brightwellii.AAC.1